MLSLTLLAVLSTAGVVLIAYGPGANWLPLLIGVALNSWMMTLYGFWLAARYASISEFVAPSLLYFVPTQLPLLAHFGIWMGWPLYLVPTQATMLLIEAGFRPIAPWQWGYAVVYLALAGAVTWRMARRAIRLLCLGRGGGEMNFRSAAALAGVDRRAIRRDSLLRLFVLFPFLIGLLMRWLVPAAQEIYGHLFDLGRISS